MSFEQIPLFEESPKPGRGVLIETTQKKTEREAAEAKAAFARMRAAVENAPSWDVLKRSGDVDDGRSRHTRKMRGAPEGDARSDSWIKDHEDRQDSR